MKFLKQVFCNDIYDIQKKRRSWSWQISRATTAKPKIWLNHFVTESMFLLLMVATQNHWQSFFTSASNTFSKPQGKQSLRERERKGTWAKPLAEATHTNMKAHIAKVVHSHCSDQESHRQLHWMWWKDFLCPILGC